MSTKIWIGDKMYLVDEPVREYVDELRAELAKAELLQQFYLEGLEKAAAERDKLETIIGTILRSIKANAVSINWIELYIKMNWKTL